MATKIIDRRCERRDSNLNARRRAEREAGKDDSMTIYGSPHGIEEDMIGDVRISTVFLGIDHNLSGVGKPLLYETMVFNGPMDQYQERWETEDQARKGHVEIMAMVQDPMISDDI